MSKSTDLLEGAAAETVAKLGEWLNGTEGLPEWYKARLAESQFTGAAERLEE